MELSWRSASRFDRSEIGIPMALMLGMREMHNLSLTFRS